VCFCGHVIQRLRGRDYFQVIYEQNEKVSRPGDGQAVPKRCIELIQSSERGVWLKAPLITLQNTSPKYWPIVRTFSKIV